VNRSGETVITCDRVADMIRALPEDRPLVWELLEQAVDANGRFRLDFVPPAAQLNLAEAQNVARARSIEATVDAILALRLSI